MNKRTATKITLSIVATACAFTSLVGCDDGGHQHSYTTSIVAPTCTEQGFTSHECYCGHFYADDYTDPIGHEFTDYVSDGNATRDEDGTKTAVCNRDGCNATHTLTDEGSKILDRVSFPAYFTLDGQTASAKVASSTEIFDFSTEMEVAGLASFTLYSDYVDELTNTPIDGTAVNLAVGENVFYLLADLPCDNATSLYTVKIVRRTTFAVSYVTDCEQTLDAHSIEEDALLPVPQIAKDGYTLIGWFISGTETEYDFNTPACADINITAKWSANTDTAYTVEIYQQTVDGLDYELISSSSEQGQTDTTATVVPQSIEHFTFNSTMSVLSANIDGDGQTALKVYYDRNAYDVTFSANGGRLVDGDEIQSILYQASAVAPTYERDGYNFVGFDVEFDCITGATSVSAVWSEPIVYTISYSYGNGENDALNPTTFTVESPSITLLAPTKSPSGYGEFVEWQLADGTAITEIANGTFANVELTAVFKQIFTRDEGTITALTEYGKTLSTVVIPETIDGVEITTISANALKDATAITSLTIGKNVSTIGDQAFSGLVGLTTLYYNATEVDDFVNGNKVFYDLGKNGSGVSVFISNNVVSIPCYAFTPYLNNPNVISITVEENSALSYIGEYAFTGLTALATLDIADARCEIAYKAFMDCSALKTVKVKSLASWLNCTIDGDQTSPLYNGATLYIDGVATTELTVANAIINKYAFAGGNFTSVVLEGVASIGNSAFEDCVNLTSVSIDGALESVSSKAFKGCVALNTLSLSTGVKYVNNSAFEGCQALTSITLPTSISVIGANAFKGCPITQINYLGTTAEWGEVVISTGWVDGNPTIICSDTQN